MSTHQFLYHRVHTGGQYDWSTHEILYIVSHSACTYTHRFTALALFDMGFSEPSVVGRGGGHQGPLIITLLHINADLIPNWLPGTYKPPNKDVSPQFLILTHVTFVKGKP